MKKTIIAAVFLVAGFICLPPVRAHITESYMHTVTKETYLYSVKGTDSLWLDKYDTPEIEGPKPCVIYIFGGAFVQGERDDQRFVPFFDWLVTEGYCVVSIDYRLGLKPLA